MIPLCKCSHERVRHHGEEFECFGRTRAGDCSCTSYRASLLPQEIVDLLCWSCGDLNSLELVSFNPPQRTIRCTSCDYEYID